MARSTRPQSVNIRQYTIFIIFFDSFSKNKNTDELRCEMSSQLASVRSTTSWANQYLPAPSLIMAVPQASTPLIQSCHPRLAASNHLEALAAPPIMSVHLYFTPAISPLHPRPMFGSASLFVLTALLFVFYGATPPAAVASFVRTVSANPQVAELFRFIFLGVAFHRYMPGVSDKLDDPRDDRGGWTPTRRDGSQIRVEL